MRRKIYFDYAAAHPVWPDVQEYVRTSMEMYFNPSSVYENAEFNQMIIENTRNKIAKMINAKPEEIYFTSGCSESNAMAIDGFLKECPQALVYSTTIEHSSIINNPNVLPVIQVDEFGFVDQESLFELQKKVQEEDKEVLWVIQHGNNVIGTIQDFDCIDTILDTGYLFVDAAQTFGREPIDVEEMGIDMLSASAGKVGGIRGVGFLYIREGTPFKPIIYGTQEQGKRGGTYFDLGIGAFGAALDNLSEAMELSIRAKRDYMIEELLNIRGVELVGIRMNRLSNNIFIKIKNTSLDSQQIVSLMDEQGFMISADSACHAGSPVFSHVLEAIGETPESARCACRITLGPETTVEQINQFVRILNETIRMYKA